jgi:NhaP-type Na+/H+ or K+/H+ antiporter
MSGQPKTRQPPRPGCRERVSSAASTNDLLTGLGLVVVLAVGSQLVAGRLRLPAIVLLLPAGFVAGIATTDVHPDVLLGGLYQPFVSVAVGVILFEAGLRLSFGELHASLRGVVLRLVAIGVLVSWAGVAVASALLFDGLGSGVPLMLGAILVVSGPTVVLPLLAFVRPTRMVRSTLAWEGTLVDPIGALLGVLVFHVVQAGSPGEPGSLLWSLGVGTLVGGAGALVLRLLLPAVQRSAPRQAAPATLMVVVAGLVCADLLRQDAGFLATTLMGMSLANQRRIDLMQTLQFQGTLVQLLIGALFILIAASVSPSDVNSLLAPTLGLVAVMVLLLRPLAVGLASLRSSLALRERGFVAWMAPRGIVAGATASAFGLELAQAGVKGADKILPITFLVIFATVCLYGLSAQPVARALGVAGSQGTTVLVVGGHALAREVGEALSRAGMRVRLWAGRREEQQAARAAGLDADHGRLIVDAVSREAELEEVTQVLLLTASDDFNALAAAELRDELGHDSVHRLAPTPGRADLLPPLNEAALVGSEDLTLDAFSERFHAGGHLVEEAHSGDAANGPAAAGLAHSPLFAVTNHGALRVATPDRPLKPDDGDTVIWLTDAPDA